MATGQGVFKGVSVSSTGLSPEDRRRVEQAVTTGGGVYSGSFSPQCSLLVAGAIGSDKYLAAFEWKRPVVRLEWVLESERVGRQLPFSEFVVKPFMGLQMCTTGFSESGVRESITSLVEQHGGRHSGALVHSETTHLIAESFTGAKCVHAHTWSTQGVNIKIVTKKWLDDCIQAGRFLPEEPYLLSPTQEASLPEKQRQRDEKKRQRELELEKEAQEREEKSRRLAIQCEKEQDLSRTFRKLGTSSTCFEAWSLYLHGFDVKRWRTALFLAQTSGATVYFEWNKNVTHVILGQHPNQEYLSTLQALSPDLSVLEMDTFSRLLDAAVSGRPQPAQQGLHAASEAAAALSGSESPRAAPAAPAAGSPSEEPPARTEGEAAESDLDETVPLERADLSRFVEQVGSGASRSDRAKPRLVRLKPQHLGPTVAWDRALVCVSRYKPTERLRVAELARQLGATFTDRLTKRNPTTTHLISKDMLGEKCKKAKQWNIPIYDLEWLEIQAKAFGTTSEAP